MAQTTGLPQYGVLLEGTADAPVIRNNSHWHILAFALQFHNAKYTAPTYMAPNFLAQFRTRPDAGIAPGTTFAIRDLPPGGGPPPQMRDGVLVSPTSATLDAVLFEDARLLGPDQGGMFNRLTSQVRVEQRVAALLLNGVATNDSDTAWRIIQELATFVPDPRARPQSSLPLGPESKAFAEQLLQVRHAQGEAAALHLAESTKNYPVIVKGE